MESRLEKGEGKNGQTLTGKIANGGEKLDRHKSKGPVEQSRGGVKELGSQFSEHTWDIRHLAERFPDSHIDVDKPEQSRGLAQAKAEQLLAKNGPNKLPALREISDLRLFFKQFLNPFWILLGVVAALNLVDYFSLKGTPGDSSSLYVAIIIFMMITVMCYISFYQERAARRIVSSFQDLLPQKCSVIRNGMEQILKSEALVLGDIIRIKGGMKLPADARVLQCSQLKLETSSITGESEPVEYSAEEVADTVSIFDSHNVAFNSSFCVDGKGLGVVIRCGADTVIGQIAALTTGQKDNESHLEIEIKQFVQFLTVITILVGLIAFIFGGFVKGWHRVAILFATSFSVCVLGMIPEGMPATVTSCLTLVARRMASRNVCLKQLDIVEALGCANIIATDKTGTLTKNEMTVTDVWYSDEYLTELPQLKPASTEGKRPVSRVQGPLRELLIVMTICNKAHFEEGEPAASRGGIVTRQRGGKKRLDSSDLEEMSRSSRQRLTVERVQGKRAIGMPSEVALIKYAEQLIDVRTCRSKYDVVFEIPFNSKRKYHVVIAKIHGEITASESHYLLLMKGAPEVLIEHCTTILSAEGDEVELTEERHSEFDNAYNAFGEKGRRVIGFAHRSFNAPSDKQFDADDEDFPLENLVFLGVCAIMDPPRDETASAIRHCKEAGIKVFMVTGDHPTTATAIGRQLKLIDDESAGQEGKEDWELVHGEMIHELTESDWDRLLTRRSLIFARTTPAEKLQIVEECQRRKQIISMTGDGVNDAPALKRATIGVAMGSGCDVAKQAADIVLTDDNFSSMVGAVEEGRLMFDNIKKLMAYLLSHAFPQVWGILINYCFGMPAGITILIILTIDLGTEILPGIAMCKEPLEGDVMHRPPRKSGQTLVGKAMLFYCYGYAGQLRALTSFVAYTAVFWSYGIGLGDLWMSTRHGYFKPELEGGRDFFVGGHNLTVTEQLSINRQAISAWQVGVVFGQCFHVFDCRTLRQSLYTQGVFSNMYIIYSICIELILLGLFVYCPGINTFLGGASPPWFVWLIVAVFGVGIHVGNELRKYCIRHWPMHPVVRCFKF